MKKENINHRDSRRRKIQSFTEKETIFFLWDSMLFISVCLCGYNFFIKRMIRKANVMNNFVTYPFLIFVFILLSSCQKEIHFDLNTASPVIVITGTISNLQGPYTVNISHTINYDMVNTFPKDTGATVQIKDTSITDEILSETSPGKYQTYVTRGIPGHTYKITVVDKGVEYNAFSTMPDPVKVDSIIIVKERNFRGKESKHIEITIKDPAGIQNYYHPELVVNSKKNTSFFVFNDNNMDGKYIRREVRARGDTSVKYNPGDTIQVILFSIDKATFDYFRTVRQASAEGGEFMSPSPANPITNLSNGALGYFSAYSIASKRYIIPK
jgi:hypothetical protein